MKVHYLFVPIFFLFSFNLSGQNPCLDDALIFVQSTSLGSPLTGPFQPNEEIEIELVVLWNGLNCNWLHGLSPTFGNGWSPTSFDANGTPEVIQPLNAQSNNMGNPGNFFWYEEGPIHYKYPDSPNYTIGEPVPAGWYSTATSPGTNNPCAGNFQVDPNCSCGITQTCNNFFPHTMRIKLITGSEEDCENGLTDLSVHFKLFSDFETGSGVNPFCADVPVISEFYQMACTIPEDLEISGQELDTYNNGSVEIDFTNFVTVVNPAVSYQWSVEGEDEISGFSDCTQDCGTILSQELVNSDLYQTKMVTYTVNAIRSDGTAGPSSEFLVKVHPEISLTTYYDQQQPVCSGVTEVYVESSAFGGAMENLDINYLYSWNTGSTDSYIIVYPEETTIYELTVTDQLGTTQTSSVTVEVIPTPQISWNTEPLPTYCVHQEYLICVDPVEETTIFEWEIKDAVMVPQDDNNCILVMWDEVISNPFICVQYASPEGCESNELCHGEFTLLDGSEYLAVSNDELETSQIEIYPNPSSEWVTIEAGSLETLKIVDGTGQLLESKKLSGESSFQMDISNFSNGIYYLMINNSDVRKLVVLR